MSIELLAIIALSFLVIVMFLLNGIRDKELSRKLKLYEKSIEELNRQNHTISKELSRISEKEPKEEDNLPQIKARIKEEVQKSLRPMVESIKEIEIVMQNFQDEQIRRIDELEDGKKVVNFAPKNMANSNEKLIISQYKSGKSEAMIARDMRIGIGEVDLILKLANLK